jgi:flagellar biosynthesis protein FliR
MLADALSISTLLGFLLTAVRVAGVFAFVPVPGLKSAVDPARVVLILAVTVALFSVWPHPAAAPSPGLLCLWILSEAGLGAGIGLTVSFAIEAFVVGAQIIGLQAGYSFASTVDPATQADSTILVAILQTFVAILFFATGLDREVLQIFVRSMTSFPPGTFSLSRADAHLVLQAGSTMFATGLRLALPIMAVMVMVDLSLALLGRVNAQLHLLPIAFPIKMAIGVTLLTSTAVLVPWLLRGAAGQAFSAARTLAGH